MSSDLSYAEFGAAFISGAVTPKRVLAVVRSIAGDEVSVGPIAAGPGGVARATATGHVGEPSARVLSSDPLVYQVVLPVDLDLIVDAAGGRHHYDVAATVRLTLSVRLERPLAIVVEPSAPGQGDVDVKVKAHGVQAKMIGKMGDIDNEIKRQVARYVVDRIDGEAAAVSRIDLTPLIDAAWPEDM